MRTVTIGFLSLCLGVRAVWRGMGSPRLETGPISEVRYGRVAWIGPPEKVAWKCRLDRRRKDLLGTGLGSSNLTLYPARLILSVLLARVIPG